MKTKRNMALIGLFFTAAALAFAIPPQTKPNPDDPVTKLTAERDALQGQLSTLTQQANTEITRLQVLAERNELAVRVLQTTKSLEDTQAALKQVQAELASVKERYALEQAKVEALLKEKNAPAGVQAKLTPPPVTAEPSKATPDKK